jgi:acetyltransferase-like isoleucine patch superfamily enzyme
MGAQAVKQAARPALDTLALLAVVPLLVLYRLRILHFTTVSTGLSLVPGQAGKFLRRAWYRSTLAACGRNLVVDFSSAIRTPHSRVGDDCYIGPWNWLGWVDIGNDFMSASHVVLLSGSGQHAFDRTDVPIRRQPGVHRCLRIGDDVWIGAHAVVSADVAAHSVVASGAAVVKSFAEYDILGGVPAAPIGSRRADEAHESPTERDDAAGEVGVVDTEQA